MSTRLATASLLVLVAIALLLPLWIVRYPPLLDYPDHLARSFIVAHLHDPAYKFRDLYVTEWGPYPYLGMDLSLIALQKLMPAETAGRVFLSICVLGLPLAGWWFLRQGNPGHDWLALWVLLTSYGLFFLEGFVNFQLGMALSLLALAAYLRYVGRPSTVRLALLVLLVTATYFSHLISFGLAGFIVLVHSLVEKLNWRRRLWVWASFVPGVLLYWKSHITAYNGLDIHFRSLPGKLFAVRAALLHAYSFRLENIFFLAIAVCFLAGWFRNREFRWNRPWVIVTAAVIALYLALPVSLGPTWAIDIRLVPMMLVLMLTVAKLGARRKALAAVALGIFAISIVNIARNFVLMQRDVAPMATAIDMLPRNSRLMPIIDPDDSHDMLHRLHNHFWAYAIIERGALAPYIFDFRGQTEVRVRDDGYVPDAPEEFPPNWDLVRRNYDYVWTWGVDYSRELEDYAREVYHSGPLHLYRMQNIGAEAKKR